VIARAAGLLEPTHEIETRSRAAFDFRNGADAVFDSVAFPRCPTWRSGHIRASLELAGDSAFNLGQLPADSFARRFARGIGAAFITTLFSDATLGKTNATAGAVTPDVKTCGGATRGSSLLFLPARIQGSFDLQRYRRKFLSWHRIRLAYQAKPSFAAQLSHRKTGQIFVLQHRTNSVPP